jgi:hypothetical protein
MRRAGGQLTGPFALAALVVLGACGRQADGAATEPSDVARPADAAAGPARPPSAAGTVTEATCATAPLGVRVVAIRRESADSIRVELALANLAAADAWTPGSPTAVAVQAAVDALDAASVLSPDGRRRMFALRGSTGERVGSPTAVPGPGRSETFWALFPAAESKVSVLLPGFAPLSGLTVATLPGRPEP